MKMIRMCDVTMPGAICGATLAAGVVVFAAASPGEGHITDKQLACLKLRKCCVTRGRASYPEFRGRDARSVTSMQKASMPDKLFVGLGGGEPLHSIYEFTPRG